MNIRKSALGVLMMSAALGQGAAYAEGPAWYAGLGVGQSMVDIGASDVDALTATESWTSTSSVDDGDTAWKIFGGIRLNANFGVEAAYMDYGTISADSAITAPTTATIGIDMDTTAWIVDAVGIMPLSDQFEIFAKLGAAIWDIDGSVAATFPGGTVNVSADDEGTDFHFGFGANYALMDNIGLRAEWERINGDDDLDAWTVGAQMSF